MPIAFDLRRGADALAVWMIVSISGRFTFRFLVSVLSVFYFSLVSSLAHPSLMTAKPSREIVFVAGVLLLLLLLPPLRLFESARRINRESGPPGVRTTGPWSIASPGVGRTSTQQGKGRTGAHALMSGLANISF